MGHVKVSFKGLPGDKLESWSFEVSGPNEDFVKGEMDAVYKLLFPPPKATDSIAAGRRIIRRSWYHTWKANYHKTGNPKEPVITPLVYCPDCYEGSYRFQGHAGAHWLKSSKNRRKLAKGK